MERRLALVVAVPLALAGGLACRGPGPRTAVVDAGPVVARERRLPSDVPGVDLVVTSRPAAGDYHAETESGVPLDHPYAVERDVHLGLVHLHCVAGGGPNVQAKAWTAPAGSFERIVTVRYDMDVLDRWDVLVSDTRLRLVHTTTSNAGVFVGSDVYELPRLGTPLTYKRALSKLPEACAPDPLVLAEVAQALTP